MINYYERYWNERETLEDFSYKWPVLKNFVPRKSKIRILDFGCGKGTILLEMRKINPKASFYGVDVSVKAINFIRKGDKKTRLYEIVDGGKLPFDDGFFDFIIASDVLEHVYDTENAFSELSRVLKTGGKILISVPYNGLLKRAIISLFFFDQIFEPSTPHIRFYTKTNLEKYLRKYKIETLKVGYYGRFYPLSNGMYIIGKKTNESPRTKRLRFLLEKASFRRLHAQTESPRFSSDKNKKNLR